jgi:hypothetical protein
MRHIALVGAIGGGAIITFFAGRYGWTLSSEPVDQMGSAFFYGFATSGGLFLHVLAKRVWRHDKRTGFFIFAVGALSFIIGVSNTLGSMASRGDQVAGAQTKNANAVKTDSDDLDDARKERRGMKFTATDQAAVDAANKKATAATTAKEACRNKSQHCQAKENEEKAALGEAEEATRNKSLTDHAAKLDEKIEKLKGSIRKADPVHEGNSQGAALARVFGQTAKEEAAKLLTWQNLAMGALAELIIIAMGTGYEALTHAHHAGQSRLPLPQAPRTTEAAISMRAPRRGQLAYHEPGEMEADELPLMAAPQRPRLISSQPEPFGNVFSICADVLEAGQGGLDFRDLRAAYVRVCQTQGKKPIDGRKFAEDVKRMCEASGIKIRPKGEDVYLLGVQLKASEKQELEDQAS